MATVDVLFACAHCHKKYKFEELSSAQHLCKVCRKRYPLVTCTYCRLDFHPIKSSLSRDERPACEHCARDFKQYGTPSFCSICNLQSAFIGRKCTRCTHSEKKYGLPVACEVCKLVCAFPKPEDVRKKVDGKTLCLLCTINYKKAQYKKKSHDQQKSSRVNHRDRDTDVEPVRLKRMRLDNSSSPSEVPSSSSSSLLTLGRPESQPMDFLTSNHVLETNKLQHEISSFKKQLSQKDQALLEKDKLICTLRAEGMEKDRDLRQKLQSQQKSHAEVVESLQAEVRALKKQISQASHKGSTKSATPYTGPSSSALSSLSVTSTS